MVHIGRYAEHIEPVLIERLQTFPDFNLDRIWQMSSYPKSIDDLMSVEAIALDESTSKFKDRWRRIRFLFENPNHDPIHAIMISNGLENGIVKDETEPWLFDGRHRFTAAVLRNDRTIQAQFRWFDLETRLALPFRVIDFLSGRTDKIVE